ncbi:MAG TPA: serine/threonine-protein kinase [Kofleriaceae bacterium]|nr:serine/threonine-protein kinase [Kofleriaceae bacterium]
MASQADPSEPAQPTAEVTALLPDGAVPEVAPLARALAPPQAAAPATSSQSALPDAGTAADAMRDEEIERTRLFIRMGWLLSVAAMVTVFVVDAQPVIATLFIAGLVIGIVVSAGYHRAFADPRNYTERALTTLSVICVINGYLAVLLYGIYSAAPLLIVIGIHFVARTEAERVARWIFASAVIVYAVMSAAIMSGIVADPGVFASDRAVGARAFAVGTLFVLATFWLAYVTARQFRFVSLAAIEDLQRATRLASQREALMDELRGDLERALRAGPGRFTDRVVGGFHLGEVLGRGAMGEVSEAADVATGAAAAVKLLRPELVADPEQRARFARELRASRALASPHVVRVLDGAADAALPYLAMERLHGQTLAERFRREPRLAPPALHALCSQVAEALDVAAAAGVVHRDLKPQNLFHTDDGLWKVLDFGVALLASDPGATGERDIIGTPHYMAPEQAQGQRVDPRADLYALGAIAYRCATGRHPFDAADPAAVLYAIVHRMPVRPSTLAAVPDDFDRWCALALAKSPERRFPSGAALVAALGAALAGELDEPLRHRADNAIRAHPWEAA